MSMLKFLEKFKSGIPRLSKKEKHECLDALQNNLLNEDRAIAPCISEAQPEGCPHCGHENLNKWGFASGLQRWKCCDCGKTFNILTKTPLARLRQKEKWLDNAEAMMEGKTVRATAEHCEVHRDTAFRWRHRFLELPRYAQQFDLKGLAESDATFFAYSEKGSKQLERQPAQRGGDGIGPGIGRDQVHVITLRDRVGKGADRVAEEKVQIHALDLYKLHLAEDTFLITDGDSPLCAAGRKRNPKAHKAVTGAASRGGNDSPFHVQTTNSFHSNLKTWMRKFNGVATKYLANYVGWHRHHFERTCNKDSNLFILLAFKPLAVSPQLTLT